jgi:diaminohydroxyphosphoribosylaminopyrimidine deaminase / 5-amino-6-(5-phosphoribosylamino)uracil reductase
LAKSGLTCNLLIMNDPRNFDEIMMLRAIALGEQGRITAPPNPWVGCVITKNGNVVGEGFHHAAGEPHAEINALQQVSDPAGTTVYVSLEPCSHFGRTPPCVDALIKSRVARVVVALEDPDPKVLGRSLKLLQEAGIETTWGICAEQAKASLEPYLHQRRTGKAFCILKAGQSIDGRIAASDATSKWITSIEARSDAHRLRAESQAILIGAGTVLADDPELTIREVFPLPKTPPLRVLLDATGKVNIPRKIFNTILAPTIVATSPLCSFKAKKEWENGGIEVVQLPLSPLYHGVDLEAVLQMLAQRGILQVLVEGGATIFGSFLKHRLANRLVLYVGPRILGDNGLPLFKSYPVSTLTEAPILKFLNSKILGDTVRLDYNF